VQRVDGAVGPPHLEGRAVVAVAVASCTPVAFIFLLTA
jgi:hypothetical protein